MLIVLLLVHGVREFVPIQDINYWLIALAFVPARYTGAAELLPGGQVSAVTSFVTYMALHGDWTHLLINCAWLLAFGGAVARRIGGLRFLAFSLVCGVVAAASHLLVHWGDAVPLVGISGAVSGHMAGAFRFFFAAAGSGGLHELRERPDMIPRMSLAEMFRTPPVLAILGIWVVLNFVFAIGGTTLSDGQSIAWEAHLGGFVAGLLLFALFDRQRIIEPPPQSYH